MADARTLVDHARVEAQNHRFTYDEPVGVEALTQGKICVVTGGADSYLAVPLLCWCCFFFLLVLSMPAMLIDLSSFV